MSKISDKIIGVLDNLQLGDTRAYDAAWQIGLMEKRCKNITKALQTVYDCAQAFEEKNTKKNKKSLVVAVEDYAKSLTDPNSQFYVGIAPIQRPVWSDCYMTSIVIYGREIRLNGGKTTDAAEFFYGEGNKILGDTKIALMRSFVIWLKSKGVTSPTVKDANL